MDSRATARLFAPLATPLWLWPNLLSLDAPAVALVWQELFARAAGFELNLVERGVLGLSIWLVYAADRWMDVARGAAPNTARHRFARTTRSVMPLVWVVAFFGDIALAWAGLEARQLVIGLGLLLASLTYFTVVHFGSALRALPSAKEAAVGALFGAGVLFALSRDGASVSATLVAPGVALALLAWANCAAIERWESSDRTGILGWLAVLALAGGCGLAVPWLWATQSSVGLALVLAALALGWVETQRDVWRLHTLRVAADAALLAPALAALLVA